MNLTEKHRVARKNSIRLILPGYLALFLHQYIIFMSLISQEKVVPWSAICRSRSDMSTHRRIQISLPLRTVRSNNKHRRISSLTDHSIHYCVARTGVSAAYNSTGGSGAEPSNSLIIGLASPPGISCAPSKGTFGGTIGWKA
jgi:hypothetical protein